MTFNSQRNLTAAPDEEWFDPLWYQARYPDVDLSGLDPREHYDRIGRRLGRHGSPQASDEQKLASVDLARHHLITLFGEPGLPDLVRRDVLSTQMFDEAWYRERYDLVIHDDPLADYFASSRDGFERDPGPLFSTKLYLALHPQSDTLHPLQHYSQHGISQGLPAISCNKANAFLDNSTLSNLTALERFFDRSAPIAVLHWEDGNFFFTDIARYTAELLVDLGFEATVHTSDDHLDHDATTLLVVAPHEYCAYGPGKNWAKERAASAIYVNTEQWHTSWFALAFAALRRSGKVLDINPAAAAAFARLGMTAGFLPLLPLPGSCFDFARAPLSPEICKSRAILPLSYSDTFSDRDYDVLFVGALSERRSQALAALAPTLAEFDNFIHCPALGGPVKPGQADMLSSSDFSQLARNARILLNIHQGESHYFEWHRMFLSGMMEGCVVVTEPSSRTGLLIPDVHYIEASLQDMPRVLLSLLTTPRGRKRLATIHANCMDLRVRVAQGERFFIP